MNAPTRRVLTVRMQGVIGIHSAEFIQKQMVEASTGMTELLLDFSPVERINSMGIALLLKALRELKFRNKKVVIMGANRTTLMLFRMMGMTHYASIQTDSSDNLQAGPRGLRSSS